ncbi:Uncharacterised protein [Mycolicibacterium vanbaalenii]|uniref:Uncharacterized protein n=1 Tax=Mycolicibacterium vanbaalenii TaxID=110539 RepID=A0A5S9R0I9_MYCVN|nr:hypothetical protein [Mycolicibacterium vanbaalenii]CAA0126460.1 Uncharacterised protein [Mycolicibacterium vanbaalenii]
MIDVQKAMELSCSFAMQAGVLMTRWLLESRLMELLAASARRRYGAIAA